MGAAILVAAVAAFVKMIDHKAAFLKSEAVFHQ